MIWAKGSRDLALSLASRPDVLRIEGNPQIQNYREEPVAVDETTPSPIRRRRWRRALTTRKRPLFGPRGFTGQGVVVADADTGFRWDHNALKKQIPRLERHSGEPRFQLA